MTEITDPTAISCKKKFLKFVEQLSTSYPPLTFERYRDADGDHTNWFPQRCHEDSASMYREWFTLAVLNNFEFMLRIKQQHPDAINIFTEIINTITHVYGTLYKKFYERT